MTDTAGTPSPNFLVDAFPISRHKRSIQRIFKPLILVSSVGFAIATSSAISLAVATSLFGETDDWAMNTLEESADAFGAATVVYGLGFITSVMAVAIPLSALEQRLQVRIRAKRSITIIVCSLQVGCFVIYLAPLWSVAWATSLLFIGVFGLFPRRVVRLAVLLGTLWCAANLLAIVWLS